MDSLSRALTRSPRHLAWAKGLRTAICVGGSLVVGVATGEMFLWSLAALGAYLVSFADDAGGAMRYRIPQIAVCVVLVTGSYWVGDLLNPTPWLAAICITGWAFAWAVASAAGPAVSVNMAMAATAILFGSETVSEGSSLVLGATFVLVGGSQVLLLTVVGWLCGAASTVRSAVRTVNESTAVAIAGCSTTSDSANEAARGAAFGAISDARDLVAGTYRSGDARRLDALRRIRAAERYIKRAAALRFATQGLRARSDQASLTEAAAMSHNLLAEFQKSLGEPVATDVPADDSPPVGKPRVIERLRPALRLHSVQSDYALRFAAVTAIGLVVTALLRVPHGGWVPLTSWRILRPGYGTTKVRGAQRVAGTVIGGIVAATALLLVSNELAMALIVGIVAFSAFALRPINYGFYSVFATVVILLLVGISGDNDLVVTLIRVFATFAGAGLALAGARFILPRWSKEGLDARMDTALSAMRDYLAALMAAVQGRYDVDRLVACRRATDAAVANLYSVVDQMTAEPIRHAGGLDVARESLSTCMALRDALVALATDFADNPGKLTSAAIESELRHAADVVSLILEQGLVHDPAVYAGLTEELAQATSELTDATMRALS